MTAILSIGDNLEGRPCLVTITALDEDIARGDCVICHREHILDRTAFESGRGPWRRAGSGSDHPYRRAAENMAIHEDDGSSEVSR